MEVCRLADSFLPLAHLGDDVDVVLSGEQPALPVGAATVLGCARAGYAPKGLPRALPLLFLGVRGLIRSTECADLEALAFPGS
jgi:hypothetical protein